MSSLNCAERKLHNDLSLASSGSTKRNSTMTQQATITDELAFSQPYGEQEKQILTPEAV
ncbi:MAG: malate synthase A, partial [Klebsiella grimontii]|nr:malate synthase A [Klebsiella grimontii]